MKILCAKEEGSVAEYSIRDDLEKRSLVRASDCSLIGHIDRDRL